MRSALLFAIILACSACGAPPDPLAPANFDISADEFAIAFDREAEPDGDGFADCRDNGAIRVCVPEERFFRRSIAAAQELDLLETSRSYRLRETVNIHLADSGISKVVVEGERWMPSGWAHFVGSLAQSLRALNTGITDDETTTLLTEVGLGLSPPTLARPQTAQRAFGDVTCTSYDDNRVRCEIVRR